MNVCVYYESNEGDMATEIGGTTDVNVFGSMRSAVRFLFEQVEKGKRDGFVLDEESELVEGDMLLFGTVLGTLRKTGYAAVTMFFRTQENWKSHYDCVIERKEIRR